MGDEFELQAVCRATSDERKLYDEVNRNDCAVSKSIPRSGDMQRGSIPGVTMRLYQDFNILIESY